MAEVAAPLGFRRGLRDDDVGTAAAVEFPDKRAADESGATGNQHTASLPCVLFFGSRHILEVCAALLYSTGLSGRRRRVLDRAASRGRVVAKLIWKKASGRLCEAAKAHPVGRLSPRETSGTT